MTRANRCFVPGYVWHLTHRCHQKDFLLKFRRDRCVWIRWLFEARKRYKLCVLDYQVTSNHIHLLVRDRGEGEIARSMQLVEGRTGQAYNCRKNRRGAFWEDRYHATAVESGEHLARCMAYIDLNMVRAGMVAHPRRWPDSGYHEIQSPPCRYAIVNRQALAETLGLQRVSDLAAFHSQLIDTALRESQGRRVAHWTEALAVGGCEFVDRISYQVKKSRAVGVPATRVGVSLVRDPAVAYLLSGRAGGSEKLGFLAAQI